MITKASRPGLPRLFLVTLKTLAWVGVLLLTAAFQNAADGADLSAKATGTFHTDGRGTPKLIFPSAPAQYKAGLGTQQVAEQFLRDHAAELKLPADLSNLELSLTQESLLGTHYRYRQILNGVPVDGADLVISVSRDSGQVYQAYNNTYPVTAAPTLAKTQFTSSNALDIAWNHLRVHGQLLNPTRAGLTYLPVSGGFRLIYKTLVEVEAPFGHWEHQIDAVSGAVLSVRETAICGGKKTHQPQDFTAYQGSVWDRTTTTKTYEAKQSLKNQSKTLNKNTVNGTALVFDGDPRTYLANASLVDSSPASAFTAAYVSRVLRDISENAGVYTLEGPWVQIINIEAPNTAPSTTSNGQWTSPRGNNAFNDAMTYFHIDQSQRYLQSLGFNSIQHASIQVDTDGVAGDDNSYFLPNSNQLSFGHGGVDDNEDADVILHEYGHAITHSIVPGWSGGDNGAIGEGFGDYWGASYSSTTTNGRTFHPEWAFSWDGHSADTWDGRFLDMTNLTYDSSHTYDAHETINSIDNYGDQLWSAPLFQSFQTLLNAGYPRTDVDKIVIQSQYGIGNSATMRDLASATTNAARLLFPSGPHAGVFTEKFRNQLILLPPSLANATFIVPAGGETYATGSVVQVTWNRQGAPPSAAARLEYSTGSATNYSDAMENGVNGWVVSHSSGALNWSQVTSSSHTATHSWLATDPATVTDQYLASPTIAIGPAAQLSFWHSLSLESGFDGGVVEISVNNGVTWIDIGTNATQNGYNATIPTSYSSPIAGRRAFSGTSGGFIQTLIPLAAYAGQNAKIRFRVGTDNSTAGTGWYVDDVLVSSQWIPIGTSATNASIFAWTLPAAQTTNAILRIQQFAPGYTDSAWTQSASFKISTNAAPIINPISLTQVTRTNGSFQFAFTNTAGAPFSVLKATNLTTPLASWQVVTGLTEISPGQFRFSAPATNGPQNFYRVRSP